MTILQFKKYSKLMKRAAELQDQLRFINEKAHSNLRSTDVPIYEIGWLNLSYGNGSWNKTILNNNDNLKEIAELIIKMISKELEEVEKEMHRI